MICQDPTFLKAYAVWWKLMNDCICQVSSKIHLDFKLDSAHAHLTCAKFNFDLEE